jgi:hypothetical protein
MKCYCKYTALSTVENWDRRDVPQSTLQEIHNLNVTSDLAAHPGSSRICQRECSEELSSLISSLKIPAVKVPAVAKLAIKSFSIKSLEITPYRSRI